ncbi:MAG: hypothetical protein ACM3WS_05930, partial [Bacillota bacterium]
ISISSNGSGLNYPSITLQLPFYLYQTHSLDTAVHGHYPLNTISSSLNGFCHFASYGVMPHGADGPAAGTLLSARATRPDGIAQTMREHRVLDLQFAQTFPHDLLFVREYTAGSPQKIRCGHLIGKQAKRAKRAKQSVPCSPSGRSAGGSAGCAGYRLPVTRSPDSECSWCASDGCGIT